MICRAMRRSLLAGVAKPTPELDPWPWPFWLLVSIWSLRPITCPLALISGPPDVPGLLGAAVVLVVVHASGALALRPLLAEAEHAAALGARGRDVYRSGVGHLVELVDRQPLGARDRQSRTHGGHCGGGAHGLGAPTARDD